MRKIFSVAFAAAVLAIGLSGCTEPKKSEAKPEAKPAAPAETPAAPAAPATPPAEKK